MCNNWTRWGNPRGGGDMAWAWGMMDGHWGLVRMGMNIHAYGMYA